MVSIDGSTIILTNERANLEDKINLETAINKLVEDGNSIVYLDLSQSTYLPSELMGLLMWKKKVLVEQGNNILISKISSSLKNIFENALLLDFFEIDSSTVVI